MRVHWLQHAEHEGLGCIAPWLARRDHAVSHTPLHAGAALPPLGAFDWLIVMGGPMNIYEHERHPWLVPEKAFIRQAIDAGKRVLGICLGAQLIADVLGGPVTRNPESEIGWHEVELLPAAQAEPAFAGFPARFDAFHWHGDTFAIPPGCRALMRSDACAHQAYARGARLAAIQFHLEVTAADARTWLELEPPQAGRYVQDARAILSGLERFAGNNRLMYRLLENVEAAA